MANLTTFVFTIGSDTATSSDGWVVWDGETVNALAGADRITGSDGYSLINVFTGDIGTVGIANFGTINTDAGGDTIKGTGSFVGVGNSGIIDTGNDNDFITGNGDIGIGNGGTINTGAGSDTITGTGGFYSYTIGIGNGGTINTGAGGDTITGTGSDVGIGNNSSDGLGVIDTGDGNDFITGTSTGSNGIGIDNSGTINTGFNNDRITGTGNYVGIYNSGTIKTKSVRIDGNDRITGTGGAFGIYNTGNIDTGGGGGTDTITGSGTNAGIFNDGIIQTGANDDVVDALIGGFGGLGTIDLSSGNDTLKGFGSGTFRGGDGTRDTLVFNPGTYTISAGVGAGNFVINGIMNVSSFELFGPGASVTTFSAAVAAGSVTFS